MNDLSITQSHKQSGLSLIELMVGITVGLMVVLAAIGTLVVTRQSATTVSDSARLTNAGNAALRTIAFTVRQAGAIELSQTGGAATPVMFGDADARGIGGNQFISGVEGVADPDTLIVRYEHQAAAVTRDCLGNAPPIPAGATSVRIDNLFDVNQVELRCAGSRGSDGALTAPAQALVGDNARPVQDIAAEDFQVWFWIRDTSTPPRQRRVNATDAAANGWESVDAVEICLQLRGTRTDMPAANFNNCRGVVTANGGRVHRLFRGTYKIRNFAG